MPDRATTLLQLLRRLLGVAGSVLLGGALAWAPVAAFTGEMVWVTKAGLAGVVLLIAMKLLPRGRVTTGPRRGESDLEA